MKIGKLLDNGKVEKEYSEINGNFGTIFKDSEAFEKKSDKICYMPELTDSDDVSEGYTYNDFIDFAKGQFEELGVEGEPEVLAKLLFEQCTWQHPTTLLDEWVNMGEFDEYPESYGIE